MNVWKHASINSPEKDRIMDILFLFPAKKCAKGMIFNSCASPNQPSCARPAPAETAWSECVEACVCETGILLQDGSEKCVAKDECGCKMDGLYFSVSVSYA